MINKHQVNNKFRNFQSNGQLRRQSSVRFIVIEFLVLLTGCNAYNYIPSPNYVPVNTEKGKITSNIDYNYFQLGYSFENHFSIYTAGNYNKNNIGIFKEHNDIYVGYRSKKDQFNQIDIGGSYFGTIGKNYCYEIISGIGKGTINYLNHWQYSHDSPSISDYKFSFDSKKVSLFIQPNFTMKIDNYFDLTLFSRLNYNKYYDLNSNLSLGSGYYKDYTKNDEFLHNKKGADLYFLEPGIQTRVGNKNVKFIVLYSRVINIQPRFIDSRKNNLHLGLSLNFNILNK
jgi:hypothetical protein